MKIWAKLVQDEKTVKQLTYIPVEKFKFSRFYFYLTEICHAMDIPTPVLLKTQIFNFAKFNFVKFTKTDFVESFDYDFLVLENIFK